MVARNIGEKVQFLVGRRFPDYWRQHKMETSDPRITAIREAALFGAMSSRDRECKGGVGKFCRERELAVNERREALDTAMQAVGQTADPQTDAAIRIVAWATHGALQPIGND